MPELAPVDEYGVPYPIHPYDSTDPGDITDENEDHAFYPNRAPELSGEHGRALRYSRVHEVAIWLHDRKHGLFKGGLERYPADEQEVFGTLVLVCAGYLPREAIDLRRRGTWKLVEMKNDVYEKVRGRQRMHFETRINSRIPRNGPDPRRTQDEAARHIGGYFTGYAKRQNLDHLKNQDFVDEFLSTPDTLRRHELGRRILKEAARVAVDPISPIYQEALDKGLIRAHILDPVDVITRLSFVGSWSEHVDDLTERLAA